MKPCASGNSAEKPMPTILRLNPPPGTRVRIISDLHLGHERCEVPGRELPPAVLEGVDMLVVAGDLAETRPCDWQEEGLRLREQLRARCRERGVELVELAGNHDPDIEPMLLSLWGGRTVIMHGHALYKEVAPWSWEYLRHKEACRELIRRFPEADTDLEARLELSRAMSSHTPPILRREGIRNRYLRGFLHCFWPPQRPLGIVWCWLSCGRRAQAFAERYFPEAETLILGHFHRSGNWHFGKRHIFNTGAWFRHAVPYVVDMQDGRVCAYGKVSK